MSDGTEISWSDATLNVVTGCTRVSEGCDHEAFCAGERLTRLDVLRAILRHMLRPVGERIGVG